MILSQIEASVAVSVIPDFLELTAWGGGWEEVVRHQTLSGGIIEHRNRGLVSLLSWAQRNEGATGGK